MATILLAMLLTMLMTLPQQQATVQAQASERQPRFVKLLCECDQETISVSVQNDLVILSEVGQRLNFSLSKDPKFKDWSIQSLEVNGVEMPGYGEGTISFALQAKEKGQYNAVVILENKETQKTKIINFTILA